MAYSRLDTGNTKPPKASVPKRSATWFLNKAVPSLSSQSLSKSINKLNQKHSKKEENEWLLLNEPSSPVVRNNSQFEEECNAESSILSDTTASDIDCIMKAEQLDSETSEEEEEDIDSIVEEFQQKIKISTAGLKDTTLRIPSVNSWRMCLLCLIIMMVACITACIGANNGNFIYFGTASTGEWF